MIDTKEQSLIEAEKGDKIKIEIFKEKIDELEIQIKKLQQVILNYSN